MLMKLIPVVPALNSTGRNYLISINELRPAGRWETTLDLPVSSVLPFNKASGPREVHNVPTDCEAYAFASCSLRGLVLGNRSIRLGEKQL